MSQHKNVHENAEKEEEGWDALTLGFLKTLRLIL